ncbi:alpha/beta hydrolase [Saccharomonospora xinjiangensis]|uniref:alpha/beta hydrolase n=1 Tax=Saccharomonospora xinjiangensis TaxID=75294 RepID=UPI0035108C51
MNTEQLRAADFGAVDSDAGAWLALADALSDSARQVGSEVLAAIRSGAWRGCSADKACDAISGNQEQLTRSADAVERVATALAKAADGWRGAQGRLRRACEQAPALGLRIAPDGTAEPLPGRDAQPRDVQELSSLAKGALAEAKSIDAELAALLGEAGGQASTTGLGGASLTVPSGKTPDEIAAWWNGLSPAQRDELVKRQPEVIGRLDGVPAADRHRANLAVLDEKIDNTTGAERQRLKEIRARIEASRSGSDVADDMYLLKLDTSGDGKIVVSIGDPDTADDVSVYVPGTTAALWGDLDTDLDRAKAMFDKANGNGGDVASVLWLDYDAPDSVLLHAPDPTYAEKGGPTLRSFVDSLKATHQDGGPHTTLVAHSYASLVVGDAAKQSPGMEADIVTVGGAGFGLDDTSGTDVEKALNLEGDVYSATGGTDVIRAAHGFEVHGDGPSELKGTEKLSVSPFTGHTGYWDDEKFLSDVSAVITGDKDDVSGPSGLQTFVDDVLTVDPGNDEWLGDVGKDVSAVIKGGVETVTSAGEKIGAVIDGGIDSAKQRLEKIF